MLRRRLSGDPASPEAREGSLDSRFHEGSKRDHILSGGGDIGCTLSSFWEDAQEPRRRGRWRRRLFFSVITAARVQSLFLS